MDGAGGVNDVVVAGAGAVVTRQDEPRSNHVVDPLDPLLEPSKGNAVWTVSFLSSLLIHYMRCSTDVCKFVWIECFNLIHFISHSFSPQQTEIYK
jgi:hypothetical protein